jgi:hypothetical protein
LDDNYQNYVNRVAGLTLPETYKSQFEYILESPKFKRLANGQVEAAPFPGYSLVTPPGKEDSENASLYENLQQCQKQLLELLDEGMMVPMPAETFHITIADLIWENAFLDAANQNPDFEQQLRSRIGESLSGCQPTLKYGPQIRWQVLGIMMRARSLAVCLLPRDESSYDQILQIRRSIYQNPDLMALAIEQQYNLTAHITLGYFTKSPEKLDGDRFAEGLSAINNQWLDTPQDMWIHRLELRKFDDMTHFYRQPDWPLLEL